MLFHLKHTRLGVGFTTPLRSQTPGRLQTHPASRADPGFKSRSVYSKIWLQPPQVRVYLSWVYNKLELNLTVYLKNYKAIYQGLPQKATPPLLCF